MTMADVWVDFILQSDKAGNRRAKCTQCDAAQHLPASEGGGEIEEYNAALAWAKQHSLAIGHTATVEVPNG